MRKPIIGVVGTGDDKDTATCTYAEEIGSLIAKRKAILLCGAKGGVMRHAAQGARKQDAGSGRIGIHPGSSGAVSAIDCAIYTVLGDARNYVNAHASDVLIALAGGPGTLSEIALALKLGRPVVLLPPWHILRPFVQSVNGARAAYVHTPSQAVDEAFRFVPSDPAQLDGRYPDLPGQENQKAKFDEYVRAKS